MRLLNTISISLEEFTEFETPKYVILSHTWENGEVLYKDIVDGSRSTKPGYRKLKSCCQKAKEDGFDWVWIDTCCINKESSAELSEAINSMFRYYKEASICYAYLSDIVSSEAEQLTSSRWFKRGWTLQELIAPPIVEFYSFDWIDIGTKTSLRTKISSQTGIPHHVLLGIDPSSCSIAERMSWASDRHTTRIEDQAYSLMGIFDVNMPLLYGEGQKAFQRLQREIFNQKADYSIFAWSHFARLSKAGIFAYSPNDFGTSRSEYRQRLCVGTLEQTCSLPPNFSIVYIHDYRKLTPVNVYDHIPTVVTRGRAPDDPPMFTSSGLRLKMLMSKSYKYARFIFLELEYEGGYLCIPEENNLRRDPYCIFRCDKTELKKMRYEYICFDTARTPKSNSIIDGIRHCPPLEWVQLLYQQPHQTYKTTLVSIRMSSSQRDAPNLLWTDKFNHSGWEEVFGVIVLEITRHRAEPSSEVGDARIAVVVGEHKFPWCVIHQDFERLGSLEDIFKSHLVCLAPTVADRDACYINRENVVSVSFRRNLGEYRKRDVAYTLSVAIHEVDQLPEWVRVCLEERSSRVCLGEGFSGQFTDSN
jgi:hypothetical protein